MAALFPLANLRDRYGIGKQADINRRKHLGVKPIKVEGTYYITEEQLKVLDRLDYWLVQQGGKMADFDPNLAVDSLESSGQLTRPDTLDSRPMETQKATLIESSEIESSEVSSAGNPEWGPLIELLAEKIQPPRSPIQNWRELEEACEKGWLLTTKQVHELAGTKPHGSQWERGSFIFIKAGKIGSQLAWQVEKKV